MINHTDMPIWIGGDADVDSAIKASVAEAAKFIKSEYGKGKHWSYDTITAGPESCQVSFVKYFVYAPGLEEANYTFDWVLEVFKYVAAGSDQESLDMGMILGPSKKDYKKSVYTWVKRGLWLTLVMLYKNGFISIPANFSALSSNSGSGAAGTRTDFAFETYPELMRFLISSRYKLAASDFWSGIPKKVCERIAQYGTRLFWMCGVTNPEQIDIDEVIEIHLTYTMGERLLTAEIPTRAIMQYVCHYYGDRVPFTLDEFLPRLEQAIRFRRNGSTPSEIRERKITGSQDSVASVDELYNFVKVWVKRDYLPKRMSTVDLFAPWCESLRDTLDIWLKSQIKYLGEKAYEREEVSALGIARFNLYLFEFLPRWYSIEGITWSYNYPYHPKDISNIFISPVEPVTGAPPSFKTFLTQMFDKNAETAPYAAMLQLKNFFSWVEAKYQHVHGYEGFVNPIHEMDLPPSNNRNESKARPFTKWQYSIALNYLAVIVNAIKLINDNVTSGDISIKDEKDFTALAMRLGWDNSFYWSGRQFRISKIPSVFLERWNIPLKNNNFVTLLYPHYVVHVLTAVDSGLRHQSVRWLCMNFDKNVVEGAGSVAFQLHVAVDKVSKVPVKSYVALQTLEALRYQREIRSLVDLESFKVDVFYRGNVDTQKAKFKPLFSSSFTSGLPRTEGAYNEMYVKFLVDFNFFLNEHDLTCKLFELKAKGFAYGATVTAGQENRTKAGDLFCPLSLVTDMTPHHTRSSTVNSWSKFLSAKDVGRFKTAHKSEAVVRYYRKLDDEDKAEISQKLALGVHQIWGGASIDPALEGSTFRKSLSADPRKAVHDFGCISISATGSDKQLDGVQRIAQGHHSGLAHYSTHICTRNGDCTDEMKAAGIEDRCGFCIYAVKGIDNLEAIEVKVINLTDEVRSLHDYADRIPGKNQHELIKVDNRLDIVVGDLLAWIWCRDHLVAAAEKFKSDSDKLYSYRPEILERDFRQFNADEDSAFYILSRLHQDSQFPDLVSEVARARYKALKLSLLSGKVSVLDIFKGTISDSPVEVVSIIRSMLKTSGIGIEDLASIWQAQDSRTNKLINDYVPVIAVAKE
ncbi:hypothetical protein GIW79_27150 [Pseudomonas sp. PA-7-1E]|uniref:hypothetical protein n=3 Tax=unclassified Pseudomonas TaxID=196821 RepID=UPI001F3B86E5|nr:hypothetical protein [Pseudomonas sp. PA-7-1E]MCF5044130.1 hypothetical protein [Pseudomonas sp. PA-7-1E]